MFLNEKIRTVLGVAATSGEFGVEVEMEGYPRWEGSAKWKRERDGSLKSPHAKEYVLTRPLNQSTAKAAVKALYKGVADSGGSIQNSMRAGVHIHMNMQEVTVRQLFTFMTVYYIYENAICHRFGPDRQGNLFCLRMTDADYVNVTIQRCLNARTLEYFNTENIRYCAGNLTALAKFGSLEFRAMQTPTTADPILEWIDLLATMKDNVLENFNNPIEVIDGMSADGWDTMARTVFGDHAEALLEVPDIEELVHNSVRLIQYWVYTTDWSAN